MKNKKAVLAVNVTLWIIIAVAGAYAANGVWRWYMIAFGVVGLALQFFAFRRPAASPSVNCSFCGRLPADGRMLVHGPNVRICSSCVATAQQIVSRGDSGGSLSAR